MDRKLSREEIAAKQAEAKRSASSYRQLAWYRQRLSGLPQHHPEVVSALDSVFDHERQLFLLELKKRKLSR